MFSHRRRLPAGGAVIAVAAVLLAILVWLPEPAPVYAVCGTPGTPPCPPKREKTPTNSTRPRPTRTPTPTETPTPTDTATPTATAIPCDTGVLTAKLTGGDEVPSVITEGQGTVKLLLDTTASAVTGNWQISNLSGFVTAAHIHTGPAGVNGGVYIGFTGLPPAGGSFATSDGAPTAKLLDVLANPPGFYVNVHTNAHPGGEIRGQLACAPAGEPVASPTPTVTATSPFVGPGPQGGGSDPSQGIGLGLLGLGGLSILAGLLGLLRPGAWVGFGEGDPGPIQLGGRDPGPTQLGGRDPGPQQIGSHVGRDPGPQNVGSHVGKDPGPISLPAVLLGLGGAAIIAGGLLLLM